MDIQLAHQIKLVCFDSLDTEHKFGSRFAYCMSFREETYYFLFARRQNWAARIALIRSGQRLQVRKDSG